MKDNQEKSDRQTMMMMMMKQSGRETSSQSLQSLTLKQELPAPPLLLVRVLTCSGWQLHWWL